MSKVVIKQTVTHHVPVTIHTVRTIECPDCYGHGRRGGFENRDICPTCNGAGTWRKVIDKQVGYRKPTRFELTGE